MHVPRFPLLKRKSGARERARKGLFTSSNNGHVTLYLTWCWTFFFVCLCCCQDKQKSYARHLSEEEVIGVYIFSGKIVGSAAVPYLRRGTGSAQQSFKSRQYSIANIQRAI